MASSKKNLKWLFALVLLIAVIGTGVYYYFLRNSSATKETFENPKIAVIPFSNLSPNSETDYLSLAFSDEVTKNLTSAMTCEVVRVRELKPDENLEERLQTLYTKSNVDLVVLGTYLINENEIEITTKLVTTFDNKLIYKHSYTVPNKEISTIPVLISNSIITKLNLRDATMVNYVINPESINQKAYQYYMKAAVLDKRESKPKSIELIQKALEIEPKFYSAWTLLASHYLEMAKDGLTPNVNYYEKATEAVKKAKEIDPDNPQAGMLLTTIYTEKGELEEALKEFKNLPKNNIDRAGRLRLGSYITRYGGLLEESIKLSKESTNYNKSKTKIFEPQLYYNGDYEAYKKSTSSGEKATFFSFYLGLVAIYQNDALAKKYFQDGRTYFEEQILGKVSQAFVLQMDGKTAEGLILLQEAEKSANEANHFDGEVLYCLVVAYAYLNDKEGVIRTLEKTIDNGFFCYPYFLNDPILNKFKDEERFQQVLETARQKHLKFKEIYFSGTALNSQ